MTRALAGLEPKELWHYFTQLNAIPRATGKEANAANFVMELAALHSLEATRDKAGNVLVLKPATPGMTCCATLALQAHLDMVHQENTGTAFDFDTQGIAMFADGDWVKAGGTTLGADNGIGVAAMLAILCSNNIAHPPLELLFTVGEEKGMTGALALPESILNAAAMLNLDTEEEGLITIGCAGSLGISVNGTYEQEPVSNSCHAFSLTITGLAGGHSGLDIHLGHGNAVKLICKLLTAVSALCTVHVSTINGGNLHNAIPREASALVVVNNPDRFVKALEQQIKSLRHFFAASDPNLRVHFQVAPLPATIMSKPDQQRVLQVINWCPDGVYALSNSLPGLVQTSNNVALLLLENGEYDLQCLTRSSVNREKEQLAKAIVRAFIAAGANVNLQNSYSGWTLKSDAGIVQHVANSYKKLFGKQPHISAMHAGLECGIISGKYPDMEIASIGPTILGAHSPEERVQVSSVQRFWHLLLDVLASMPGPESISTAKNCAEKASH